LDVTQRDAGIEGSGDEGVAQGVWSDSLVDPRMAGDSPHDPRRPVAVETAAVAADKDRSLGPFADNQVDGASGARREWDRDGLAALAHHDQRAVPAL
jgi:hypothetical protein